ncbi:hypothetical protein BI361_03580 [Salmonella enterica]|nr:hypothetical protein [Salmonella enterica]
MARPASRKAVSSLPAIANIDEQLDEVVMDELKRIINGRVAENSRTPSQLEMEHMKEMIQKQWKEAYSTALSNAQGNGCYPFNQPGWVEQSQQRKIF